jgi:hypothetical protein
MGFHVILPWTRLHFVTGSGNDGILTPYLYLDLDEMKRLS